MSDFLGSIKRALAGQEQPKDRVRRLLIAAQRSHASVQLESTIAAAESGTPVASIEQVRAEDLIISQPLIGGRTHPLAVNEPLQIRVRAESGSMIGQTRSLGRIKLPSGGERVFYGYRLALPADLRVDEQGMRNAG